MKIQRVRAVVACTLTLAAFGCARKEPAEAPKPEQAAAAKAPKVEEKPQPYSYPAPVKGHFKETNIGSFDVVDGIAYRSGAGTVVFVTSKPIASPMLAGSPCPMTAARSLVALRDASYLEVNLDAAGRSKYFVAGNAFGGSSREEAPGSRSWSSKLKAGSGHAAGSVQHRHGGFEFDLAVLTPIAAEVSQGDWVQGKRSNESLSRPAEQAVTAAYRAAHDAALKKDWKALVAAIGFDQRQADAIRGLEGIDADLALYADRFLQPGEPGEFTAQAGKAYVRAEGTNSKGKKFANFYHVAPCGDRLVLVSIAENPQ
jgi:hypothetical protein